MRVSVVMPSLNQGCFIKEAIESVLSQGYEPKELIVMDGGSTDETLNILKAYGDKIVFWSQPDQGQSDAINRGLKKASGDILCWLNSDDLFEPGALSSVVEAFGKNPEVDFIYGNGYNVNERNGIIGLSGVKPFNRWKLIHHRNFVQQPSCFFRRGLLERVGLLREDLHYVMDWDLWIRFSLYQGMFLDRYLSRNRTYLENKTVGGRFRRWREIQKMLYQYSHKKLTPAILLYFLEAILQTLQKKPLGRTVFGLPLRSLFFWGMEHEFSGCFADGSVSKRFYFTVPNPEERSRAILRLRFPDTDAKPSLRTPPLSIRWKSSENHRGVFRVRPSNELQAFAIPLSNKEKKGFVHFSFSANLENTGWSSIFAPTRSKVHLSLQDVKAE